MASFTQHTVSATFSKTYQVKQGRKMVSKTSTWTETAPDADFARLRAMALNWNLVAVEPLKGGV